MTMEEYQAWQRQEFIRKNGMTPEEWAAGVQSQISTQTAAANAAYEAETEKVRAELRRRGVNFPANATRDQLLELLRQNPAPSKGGQAANAINSLNPATVLLRSGILLALKLNLFGVAAKLRWALVTQATATSAGMSAADHSKTKTTYEKLRDIFYKAGGKPENLNNAILHGKGNKENPIGSGPSSPSGSMNGTVQGLLGPSLYRNENLSQCNRLNGLGEPVSATAAIAAATAAMTAIAAILKAVKAPKGAADGEMPSDNMTFDESSETGIQAGLENENGGSSEGDKPKGLVEWVKANPLPSAGIAIAAVGGGYFLVKAVAPKKKGLAGPPRSTKRKISPNPKRRKKRTGRRKTSVRKPNVSPVR
jgi:hypothetical protein